MGWGDEYECMVMEGNKEWLGEMEGYGEGDVVIDSVFGFGEVKEAFERMGTGRCKGEGCC